MAEVQRMTVADCQGDGRRARRFCLGGGRCAYRRTVFAARSLRRRGVKRCVLPRTRDEAPRISSFAPRILESLAWHQRVELLPTGHSGIPEDDGQI